MEDREALEILKHLAKKGSLTDGEREALRVAIGILSWSKLAEGRMRSIKHSRDRRERENSDEY